MEEYSREGTVAVFNGLIFLGEAGDFGKADAGAAPLDGEMKNRKWILLQA